MGYEFRKDFNVSVPAFLMPSVLLRVLQRNKKRAREQEREKEREISFKELAEMFMCGSFTETRASEALPSPIRKGLVWGAREAHPGLPASSLSPGSAAGATGPQVLGLARLFTFVSL